MGLFGVTFKDMIEEYSQSCNGIISKGGIMNPIYMTFEHNNHTIKVETYMFMAGNVPITYFRVSSIFEELKTFDIKISREGMFSSVSKFLGAMDIQIDHEEFDKRFMIKGNDEELVRKVLDDKLRESLFDMNGFTLYTSTGGALSGINVPHDMKAIILEVHTVPKSTDEMSNYIQVVKNSLDSIIFSGIGNSVRNDHII